MNLSEAILVKINAKGQPLSLQLGGRVLQFKYEDTEKKDDMLSITFADPYKELVDSDQFLENTEWTVQWGFPQALHPARKVLVKSPKFKHGELEVQALDKGTLLKNEESWKVEKLKTAEEMIKEIGQKYNLKTKIDSLNIPFDSFPMGGMTPWDTLKYFESRAEDHYFRVDSDTLVFKKRELDQAPVASFEYTPGRYSRLIDYECVVKDQQNAKSSTRVTAVSVDPLTGQKKVFNADEGTTPVTSLGDRRPLDGYVTSFTSEILSSLGNKLGGRFSQPKQGEYTGKSIILPPKSDEELASIAKSKRRESLLNNVEAKFEILASPDDPFLKSGDIIQINGIGVKFSGNYRIVKITHDLSNGYRYQIEAKRNALGGKGKGKLNGSKNLKGAVAKFAEALGVPVKGSKSGKVVK